MTRPPSSDDDSAPTVQRDLTVRVEFVVVDGPAAAVWQARQTAAIRALLAWVADQQAKDSTEDGAGDARQGRASRRRAA
jgi:hypothetical protein